eukprot:TRINITY_DN2890_c0_g1_i1.p1 TRINITY_DN2890_c0_g1~~TRINITY_DN2890_c0_g1_i1.p1  ORF type:complete len:389 (-),score=138.57 TRINITY_DN2890_c0_g1_i1:42-1157(-)
MEQNITKIPLFAAEEGRCRANHEECVGILSEITNHISLFTEEACAGLRSDWFTLQLLTQQMKVHLRHIQENQAKWKSANNTNNNNNGGNNNNNNNNNNGSNSNSGNNNNNNQQENSVNNNNNNNNDENENNNNNNQNQNNNNQNNLNNSNQSQTQTQQPKPRYKEVKRFDPENPGQPLQDGMFFHWTLQLPFNSNSTPKINANISTTSLDSERNTNTHTTTNTNVNINPPSIQEELTEQQLKPKSKPTSNNGKRARQTYNNQPSLSSQGQTTGCHYCGIESSPQWRRGPDGGKTLCNACGLQYARVLKRRKIVSSSAQGSNHLMVEDSVSDHSTREDTPTETSSPVAIPSSSKITIHLNPNQKGDLSFILN